ncbi:hypothetical protein ONZ51_g5229 [Trametes cubensis]|uniref:Uncharacterized protein n=1 Tax=Trametes cubensis TaxID=1111947 RepID=A0AAD7TWR5_9APHY|nr:hypothetical protein ONZ51_g5229 [Trametes cubensis]
MARRLGKPTYADISAHTICCLGTQGTFTKQKHIETDDGLEVLKLSPKFAEAVERISRRSTLTLDTIRMNKELIDLKVFRSKRPTVNELLIELMRVEEKLQAANTALQAALLACDSASAEVQSLQTRCAMLEEKRNSCRTELAFTRGGLDNSEGGEDDPMDVDSPEEPEARPSTPPPQPSSSTTLLPMQRVPTLPDVTTGPPVTPMRNPTLRMPSEHGLPTPPTTDEQPRRQPLLRTLNSLSYASLLEQEGNTPTAGISGSAPSEQHLQVPNVPMTPQTPTPNFMVTPPPTAPRISIGDVQNLLDLYKVQQGEEDRQRDARESELREKITARDKEVADLRTTIKECWTEMAELKKQIQECQQREQGYQRREEGYKKREEDYKKREAELRGKIKTLEEDIASHKEILGRNKDQIAKLGRELEQCKAQNVALAAQLKRAERALDDAQHEHANLRESITRFSGGLHQVLGQHKDILQPGTTPAGGDGDGGPIGPLQ